MYTNIYGFGNQFVQSSDNGNNTNNYCYIIAAVLPYSEINPLSS